MHLNAGQLVLRQTGCAAMNFVDFAHLADMLR